MLPALSTLHAIKLWLGSTAKVMAFLALFALMGGVTASELEVGQRFRDCPECPEMVVVPSGSFLMGAPESEAGSYANERPVHMLAVRSFAAGVYEVTFAEFGRFVDETGYSAANLCYVSEGGEWEYRFGRGWRNPGFGQSGRHPAVCVGWDDARAYAAWLSRETGEEYRLPSESEWEYAARAGTTGPFHTGGTISPDQANYNGQWSYPSGDRDSGGLYRGRTVPVGSFPPNAFGLYDMHGNVWEWVQDCWNDSYQGAPSDGRAWESGDCQARVLRGGSWVNEPRFLRSASRDRSSFGLLHDNGFRVARTLTP